MKKEYDEHYWIKKIEEIEEMKSIYLTHTIYLMSEELSKRIRNGKLCKQE